MVVPSHNAVETISEKILDDIFLRETASPCTRLLNLHCYISVAVPFIYLLLHLSAPIFPATTKLLRYWDMEDRTLKRIRAEMEEQEADTDSRVTERRFLQTSSEPLHRGTGSFSELLLLGTGSKYSRFKQPGPSSSDEGSVSRFDVFICHRGPDTKQTLAYHLYDMLCDRGVMVFLDKEELQSGETLTEAIEEALACSHVHVCILSSGFAESPWCLRELVMMLGQHGIGTSTLIPIFYDVEPSHVRHVKGDFGQGFQKLKSKGRYSSEDIDQWREALAKIAEIKGYEGKGEFCRTIVNRICKLLDVGAMVTSGKVVGREEQLLSTIDSIMRFHHNRFGVTLVEISGVAGMGKTTFAKELYNNIYSQYQRCCFIEDVNGLVEKGGVNEVHKQLLSQLFKDGESYPSEIMKKYLWKRLQNAEILLVLDNIHRKLPLSTVFIENVSSSPSSIIIVTCREKGVLKHDPAITDLHPKNLIELEISNLNFYASKEIFCRYAFAGIENVKDEFDELVNKMVKKCNGIPLALASLGANLHEKDIGYWNYLWISIKDSLLSDVKEILKFTYDNLGTELEKCLFLDVATFFYLEEEELLVKLRQSDDEDGELKVRSALNVLKKKHLIHEYYGVLHMHDVFVDLGRSIVQDEDPCPGHRSRVWSPSDVKNMLSYETGTQKVKALCLVSKGSIILDDDEYPWSIDAFSKLSSLEILILHGHCIEGDLSKLSRRLLWLKWTDFPFKKIPRTPYLKHVKVLYVDGEKLICLWEHREREAPSNLRKLIVQDCIKLERLPESMGKLRQLTSMNLHKCTSLKIIPDSFGQLQVLRHLELDGCHALERLPETFGGLKRLHSLTMRDCCSMVSLPESFGDLRSLSELTIEKCHAMLSLPESSGKLGQLQSLWIIHCDALEGLPQSLRCWTNLVDVYVDGCAKIRLSPEQFQGIHSPKSQLGLSVYEDDMEVADSLFGRTDPGNFVQPIQIKQQTYTAGLLLADNNNNKRHAPELSDFELTANHVIESAGGLPGGVHTLNLVGFCNIQELPQSLCNLRHLGKLSLSYYYNLQKLPESIGSLSFLKYLSLERCFNLEKVDPIGSLKNLRSLRINTCFALKELPSCIGNLSRLEVLTVTDCWMMEEIHTEALFSLTRLCVSGWVNLSRIVGLCDLFNLEYLTIQGCWNMREIMVGPGQFNQLRELDWELSLNHDIFSPCYINANDTQMFPAVLGRLFNAKESGILNVKASPALSLVVGQKMTQFLGGQDMCFFYKLPSTRIHGTHVLSLPFFPQAVVLCIISSIYSADLPRHVPPPKTHFEFSTALNHYHEGKCLRPDAECSFRRSDCGEEIHFAALPFGRYGDIKSWPTDICVNIEKGKSMSFMCNPNYEAVVKDGWIIYVQYGKEFLVKEMRNIVYSEFRKQRLISCAWTQLPSQLQIHEFSALDIAGCQITKISRHGNTCIMEEESGLIWSKRRCLFMDDHALLLHHPKGSEHSFLAYPEIDRDLERVLANLYEMSISILLKGEVVSSRKLQQIIPITEEEIPLHLNTLLQGGDIHSSSETMRRVKLLMLKKVMKKSLYYHTGAES